MNVFVLGTGRCGSVTFARACGHFTNYTSGHETRARLVGDERLNYPPDHIEVDNRLSWFLGPLAARFPDETTLYVHLVRDHDAVVDSFARRWDSPFRASIIRAFGHGIVMRTSDWPEDEIRGVCSTYVSTVNDNIREFLRHRDAVEVDIANGIEMLPRIADRIGAAGDIEAALAELAVHHNASSD
jgi:hypothetical protein